MARHLRVTLTPPYVLSGSARIEGLTLRFDLYYNSRCDISNKIISRNNLPLVKNWLSPSHVYSDEPVGSSTSQLIYDFCAWQGRTNETVKVATKKSPCVRSALDSGLHKHLYGAACSGWTVLRFSAELQLLLNHIVNSSSKSPTEERHLCASRGWNRKGSRKKNKRAKLARVRPLWNNAYTDVNSESFWSCRFISLVSETHKGRYVFILKKSYYRLTWEQNKFILQNFILFFSLSLINDQMSHAGALGSFIINVKLFSVLGLLAGK